MEKINILMATYNGRRYVAKQVESILNQTYKDFRLIISDDNSTDSTLKILEEYEAKDKRIEIYRQGKNLGVVANFEFLIGKVRSEYFMFADQDDVWNPDKIEKTLKKMEETNSDLVYTDLEVVDSRLRQIAPSYWSLKGLDYRIKKYNNFESLYLNNFVTGCTMLVKSKWINEFMPLPKSSKYVLHDYWIALIISQTGKITYLDEPTLKYRQHTNNKIGSKTKSEELETIDEIRKLFIDVKEQHFSVFVENEKYFKNAKVIELNKNALEYYKNLKTFDKFSLSNIKMFLKLYKYESFNYKIKNFAILHMPVIAKIPFNKMKAKQKNEIEMAKVKKAEEMLAKKEKAQSKKIEKQNLKIEEDKSTSRKKQNKNNEKKQNDN